MTAVAAVGAATKAVKVFLKPIKPISKVCPKSITTTSTRCR